MRIRLYKAFALCYLSGVLLNKPKKTLLLIPLAALVLLAPSCAPEAVSSASAESLLPSSSDYTSIHDLREAFAAFPSAHSYKMHVVVAPATGDKTIYDVTYAENYVFSEEPSADWGYALSEKGVYALSLQEDAVKGGELVTGADENVIKSLWDSGLFSTLASVPASLFPSGSRQEDITDKLARLAVFSVLDLPSSSYVSLEKMTASLTASIDTLSLLLTFTKFTVTASFSAFGSAESDLVLAYLKAGGSYLTPVEPFREARDLFKANNFSRTAYSLSDNVTVVGTEHFLPTYFYGEYNAKGASEGYSSFGLLGIDHKTYNGALLDGSYYFTLSGTTISLLSSKAYSGSSDIPGVVYNYPSNLLLWKRYEAFATNGEGASLTTSDSRILADFVANYQIGSVLTSNGATATSLTMAITNIENAQAKVLFTLAYEKTGHATGEIPFEMVDFGRANLAAVDNFIATNHLG